MTRTVPEKCRGCGAPIAWVFSTKTPKPYASVPIDWDSAHAEVQQALKDGHRLNYGLGMVSHFTTCPKASDFSKSKKGPSNAT